MSLRTRISWRARPGSVCDSRFSPKPGRLAVQRWPPRSSSSRCSQSTATSTSASTSTVAAATTSDNPPHEQSGVWGSRPPRRRDQIILDAANLQNDPRPSSSVRLEPGPGSDCPTGAEPSPTVAEHRVPDTRLQDTEDNVVQGREDAFPGGTRVPIEQTSVLDKVVTRYPSPRETLLSRQRYFRGRRQQLRLEQLQAQRGQRAANWRSVLDILRRRTPRPKSKTPSQTRTLYVTPEVADLLLHEVDRTIWDIHDRTDCHIALSKRKRKHQNDVPKAPNDPAKHTVTLVLHGSDEMIERARAEIAHIAQRYSQANALADEVREPDGPPSSDLPATAENTEGEDGPDNDNPLYTWSTTVEAQRPAFVIKYNMRCKYEDVPRPSKWTPKTLESYVAAIAKGKMPVHIVRSSYGTHEAAKKAAFTLLYKTLNSKEVASSLTTRSYKLAFQCIMLWGPSFLPERRALAESMDKAGLLMDTALCNNLLRSNVTTKNLKSFETMLEQMTRRGLRPNLGTWALFLAIIEDIEVKQHILRALSDNGLLQSVTGKKVMAEELLKYELERERGRWKGLSTFLADLNERFGPGWLTTWSIHSIVRELGSLGKWASCCDFIDMLILLLDGQYGERPERPRVTSGNSRPPSLHVLPPRPTRKTLNIALMHANIQKNPVAACVLLERFHKLKLYPDKHCFHNLFTLFFRLRWPNAMAAVWHYACILGETTWSMRRRVSEMYDSFPELLGAADAETPASSSSSGSSSPPGHESEQGQITRKTSNRRIGIYQNSSLLDVPTFHTPDMLPDLLKTKLDGTGVPYRPFSGSVIARLYNTQFPSSDWRPGTHLHLVLEEACRADRKLSSEASARRQMAKLTGETAAADGTTADPERDGGGSAAVDQGYFFQPGIKFSLVRRRRDEREEAAAVPLQPAIMSRWGARGAFSHVDPELDWETDVGPASRSDEMSLARRVKNSRGPSTAGHT